MSHENFDTHIGFYCAFCRTPRRAQLKKHIDAWNVIAMAITSGVSMMALWGRFDARVFVIFAFLLSMTEIVIQFRWRMSLICHSCGFDPVVYVKDPPAAARKVREKLEKRRTDPSMALARPLNLPVVRESKRMVEPPTGPQ